MSDARHVEGQAADSAAKHSAERSTADNDTLTLADEVLGKLDICRTTITGLEGEWLDLRGVHLSDRLREWGMSPQSLMKCSFSNVLFGTRDRAKPPAILADLGLADSTFSNVLFIYVALEGAYCRKCRFTDCDFRYAQFARTSFQDATLAKCDLYRAHFAAANVFSNATFIGVSLDKAWLEGITGLTKAMFDDPATGPALAQERSDEDYTDWLGLRKRDRPTQHTIERAVEDKKSEAADVYRALSGLWTAQGQFDDASFAYVRSKTLEREYMEPRHVRRVNAARVDRNAQRQQARARKVAAGGDPSKVTEKDREYADEEDDAMMLYGARGFLSYIWLWLAGRAKYGESVPRVAFAVAALTSIPAVAYWLLGGVREHGEQIDVSAHPVASLGKCMLFSLEQLTTSSTNDLKSANHWVDLIGTSQTVLGIVLLGLLGFVLGNKLRSA
jgi:uncharacterized protein YjbI with pentapeptide repeats